jgi:non-specific serine/threonine protein kinase
MALWSIGIERCRAGDLLGALEAEQASVQLRIDLGSSYLVGWNLDVLAWVAIADGESERGGRLMGAAEAIMRDAAVGTVVASGPTATYHKGYQARAREALGPDAFAAEYEAGQRMSFDDAVAYAVGAPSAPAYFVEATATSDERLGSPVPNPPLLTPREWQVATLVAQGLSNRQIATKLVISQRTAEGHVEHVLTKLGFTSRTQIATWVISQDSRTQGPGG